MGNRKANNQSTHMCDGQKSYIPYKALNEFLRELEEKTKGVDFQRNMMVFRGQRNSTFPPVPSLFRKNFAISEYQIINDAVCIRPDEFNKCQNTFEILLTLQHYQIPTRLLDCTTNPLIALFFACYEEHPKETDVDASVNIYLVPNNRIFFWNDKAVDEMLNFAIRPDWDTIDVENTQLPEHMRKARLRPEDVILVKPRALNPRIAFQQGMFFLPGQPIPNPVDKEVKNNDLRDNKKSFLRAYEKTVIKIKASDIPDLFKDLSLLGIQEYSVYPELTHFESFIPKAKIK